MKAAAVAACLLACGGKHADDANGWAARPLEPASGHVGIGKTQLAYTLSVPHGLGVDPDHASGSHIIYEANIEGRPAGTDPSIDLVFDPYPPATLDAAVRDASSEAGDEVVAKQALPDGFLVVVRSHDTHWRVERIVRVGALAVHCLGQQAVHTGDPMVASRALLERICASLAISE